MTALPYAPRHYEPIKRLRDKMAKAQVAFSQTQSTLPDFVRRHGSTLSLISPLTWWLGTELNRVHWLFRPALCRRVPEPNLVDGARLELAFHGCRPWVIPLYEPPSWGEMGESNSRNCSHNPVPKPFGQSRHRIWSCWLDFHQHRPAYKAGAFVCRPQQQNFLELARSLELRSGAYRAPALPVELYQRSWRGDS